MARWIAKTIESYHCEYEVEADTIQEALKKAFATGGGQAVRRVISDVRRAMSAQPALNDETEDFTNNPIDYVNALRSKF